MKILLKGLNPLIWLVNLFRYKAHLQSLGTSEYSPYDASKDLKYF
jgi:hypothetical protein